MEARVFHQDGLNNTFDPTDLLTEMAQLRATSPQFVSASTMTIDGLLAAYPAAPPVRGKYARVSDYGGDVDRVLRCDYFASLDLYQWVPTLADYGRSIPLTANTTLVGLKSPPSIVFTGTIPLGTTFNVTIAQTNRRPGEIVEIKAGLTSLLGTLNILGLGLGSGVGILLGNYQKYMFDGSSGALQLVRLV